MKIVTIQAVREDTSLLELAANGEELVVTKFGKPYVRILPAGMPKTFLGAGSHLAASKKPLSHEPIPKSEWKGLARSI